MEISQSHIDSVRHHAEQLFESGQSDIQAAWDSGDDDTGFIIEYIRQMRDSERRSGVVDLHLQTLSDQQIELLVNYGQWADWEDLSLEGLRRFLTLI